MIEAMKQWLETLEDFVDVIKYDNEQDDIGRRACCDVLSYKPHSESCKAKQAITAIKQAIKELESQEPVAFLANAMRFKLSFDSEGKVNCFWNQKELDGRWVALVAAEDDCHLKLTHPPQRTDQLKACVYCGQLVAKELNT
jgi:hypothetical protein